MSQDVLNILSMSHIQVFDFGTTVEIYRLTKGQINIHVLKCFFLYKTGVTFYMHACVNHAVIMIMFF